MEEETVPGIKSALDEGPATGSPLYVFTDAPPKDASELGYVTDAAKATGTNVYFFQSTTSCGAADEFKPFKELAKDTCGQVFELPKSSAEFSKMKKVTKGLLGGTVCLSGITIPPLFGKRIETKGYSPRL